MDRYAATRIATYEGERQILEPLLTKLKRPWPVSMTRISMGVFDDIRLAKKIKTLSAPDSLILSSVSLKFKLC